MSRSKQQILFLAPQPFYQERGTPIAVKMALEALAEQYSIELLTYHEGFDISIPNVHHHRMWAPKWLRGIRPGVSIKKLIADVFFFFEAINLLRKGNYDAIHAVEESVFMALPAALFFKKPLIYDMDSSLAQQILERWYWLGFLKPLFSGMEAVAVRNSAGVLGVCDELVTLATKEGAKEVSALYDISLLEEQSQPTQENLLVTIDAPADAHLILYIGNLEGYQGISLLVESLPHLTSLSSSAHCVVIGGAPGQIEHYANKARQFGVHEKIHFIGPRPLSQLGSYLKQAHVLVSPRIKGNNTPMKVYSYLDSGIPLVATLLPTHTQAMTEKECFLVEPKPKAFAQGIFEALVNKHEAESKTKNAKLLVEKRYTIGAFRKTLLEFYQKIFKQ